MRDARRPARAALCTLSAALLAIVFGYAPACAEAPARLLFDSDFELGAIDDLTLPEISDPQFLEDWVQQFPDATHPRFMQVRLAVSKPRPGRHLSVPIRGARARLISKNPVPVAERQLLRCTALVRSDALGKQGRWGLRMVTTAGDSFTLLEGDGTPAEWRPLERDLLVPAGVTEGRLELWVESQHGLKTGEFAIDDLRLAAIPRATWSFDRPLRRIQEGEEFPFTIASVGYPTDTYRMIFTVLDSAGREQMREEKTLLVSDEHPIDFTPRFDWSRHALGRGIYDMVLRLEAKSGWHDVQQRRFALTGPPPFERRAGGILWGFECAAGAEEPAWLVPLAPDRLLLDYPPADDERPLALPAWLVRYGKVQSAGVVDARSWGPEHVARIEAFSSRLPDWYIREAPKLAEVERCFAEMRARAPYLRAGVIYDSPAPPPAVGPAAGAAPRARNSIITVPPHPALGEALSAAGELPEGWGARIDLSGIERGAVAATLGKTLFALAKWRPASVLLAAPDDVLLERPDTGEAVSSEAMLVWEFATAFLSAAEFLAEEPLDARVRTYVFRRAGEDFVVVPGDAEQAVLSVHSAGRVLAYDQTGTPRTYERDASGRVHIEVGSDLLLVQGLDLARIRTINSVIAAGQGVGNSGDEQLVTVSVTNYYKTPARVSLDLHTPPTWEGEWKIEPRRIDSERTEQWEYRFRVPPWFGIEGSNTLEGRIRIEPASGPEVVMPVTLDVPMGSKYVEVKLLGAGREDADVLVRNLTQEPLSLTVYLLVRPAGVEKSWVEQTLAAGGERTYRLEFGAGGVPGGPAAAGSGATELWVGVTLNKQQSYLNRVYPLPRR